MGSAIAESVSVRDEIDEGLGSIGRFRIMAELARDPERRMTIYSIAAVTRLKRVDIKANLAHLVRIGWVRAHASSPPVKYQVDLSNARAARLADFLRSSGYFQSEYR